MTAGRPPKPTPLKVLKGTFRKDRSNLQEPQLAPAIPPCPSWLPAKAKRAYREVAELLFDMGVLTLADRKALELVCYAYAEWRELAAYLKKHGRTYDAITEHGTTLQRPRPECAMEAELYRRVWGAIARFGLTPADRARVSAAQPDKPDPFTELLNRQRQHKLSPPDDPEPDSA